MTPTSRRLAATAHAPLPDAGLSPARRLILETALQLCAERGYSGTSIRDIAAACGLKGPTLYSHYASKEAVLAEILRMGHEEHLRYVRTALLDCESDPRAQIRAWATGHVRFHTDFPMLAVVTNSEMHMLSAEALAPILGVRRQAEQMLHDIIERGRARKRFNVLDPWLSAAAIGGMGLRVAFWFAPGGKFSAQQVADNYAEFALRVLGDGGKS